MSIFNCFDYFTCYDTVIFDLDRTVWNTIGNDGNYIWAKQMDVNSLKKESGQVISDGKGNKIYLEYMVDNLIKHLYFEQINIGFLSIGGLKNVPFDSQPSIILLKEFGLYQYFEFIKVILYKDQSKSNYLYTYGKTLFIDDNPKEIESAYNMKLDNLSLLHKPYFTYPNGIIQMEYNYKWNTTING